MHICEVNQQTSKVTNPLVHKMSTKWSNAAELLLCVYDNFADIH